MRFFSCTQSTYFTLFHLLLAPSCCAKIHSTRRLLGVVPVLRAGLCLNITNWLWALAVAVMGMFYSCLGHRDSHLSQVCASDLNGHSADVLIEKYGSQVYEHEYYKGRHKGGRGWDGIWTGGKISHSCRLSDYGHLQLLLARSPAHRKNQESY